MEKINIMTAGKTVDNIRREIDQQIEANPDTNIYLYTEAKWVIFWENHKEFMPEEKGKWVRVVLNE